MFFTTVEPQYSRPEQNYVWQWHSNAFKASWFNVKLGALIHQGRAEAWSPEG